MSRVKLQSLNKLSCLDETFVDSDFIISSSYNHCDIPVFNLFFQPLLGLTIIVYTRSESLPVFKSTLIYQKLSFGHVGNINNIASSKKEKLTKTYNIGNQPHLFHTF